MATKRLATALRTLADEESAAHDAEQADASLFSALLAKHSLSQHAHAFIAVGVTTMTALALAPDDAISVVQHSLSAVTSAPPRVAAARTEAKRKYDDIQVQLQADEELERRAASAAAAAAAAAVAAQEQAAAAAVAEAASSKEKRQADALREQVRAHFTEQLLRQQLAKSLCQTACANKSEHAPFARLCFKDGRYDVRAGGAKPQPGELLEDVKCHLVSVGGDGLHTLAREHTGGLIPQVLCPVDGCGAWRNCEWRGSKRKPFRVKVQAANLLKHLSAVHSSWEDKQATQRRSARMDQDRSARKRTELFELFHGAMQRNLEAKSSHGHRWNFSMRLGDRELDPAAVEALCKSYSYLVYFNSRLSRHGYDFLYQSLLAGALPSLDTTLRYHARHMDVRPLSNFGFHFTRFCDIVRWRDAMGIPLSTLFHLAQDETACVAWVDFSSLTGELVGLCVPDTFISSVDLRPTSAADVRRLLQEQFRPATKICCLLLCPLTIHRPSLLLAVFGARADDASAQYMLRRLAVAADCSFRLAGIRVVSYAHDASSGEHSATKQYAASTIAASVRAITDDATQRLHHIVFHLPRPAVSVGGARTLVVRELHGRVTPSKLADVKYVHNLRNKEPSLQIAWPVLDGSHSQLLPFIDSVHIAKCLFSALRSSSMSLQLGHGIASTSCVLEAFDQHQPRYAAGLHFGVQRGDLLSPKSRNSALDEGCLNSQRPVDPMRFPPVERFCGEPMTCALQELAKHSHDANATLAFQRVIRDGALALLEPDVFILDRIQRLAFAFYFLSGWRQWLQRRGFHLGRHFVPHCHVTSILTNLVSLVLLALFLGQTSPGYRLPTWLLSSQWCEDFFRRLRDVHGLPLFSSLQALRRSTAIELYTALLARYRDVLSLPSRSGSAKLDELHHDAMFTGSECPPDLCQPDRITVVCLTARTEAEALLFSLGATLLENEPLPTPQASSAQTTSGPLPPSTRDLDREELDSDDDVSDGDFLALYARGTRRGAESEVSAEFDLLDVANIDVNDEAEKLRAHITIPSIDVRLWARGIANTPARDQIDVAFSEEDLRCFAFGRTTDVLPRRLTSSYLPVDNSSGAELIHIRTLCAELCGRPTNSKDRTTRVRDTQPSESGDVGESEEDDPVMEE